ncbi:MAG TPA: DUF6394 family protein [Candidatus Nanopelagicales bacterium]
MNLEKVIFGFFVVLAATLNFGFVIGAIDNPALHNPYELFAAIVVNLIATILKFGDRTQLGAVHLATSLVASLQLIAAGISWVLVAQNGVTGGEMASVVSLAAGALLANVVSVVLLIAETISFQRR